MPLQDIEEERSYGEPSNGAEAATVSLMRIVKSIYSQPGQSIRAEYASEYHLKGLQWLAVARLASRGATKGAPGLIMSRQPLCNIGRSLYKPCLCFCFKLLDLAKKLQHCRWIDLPVSDVFHLIIMGLCLCLCLCADCSLVLFSLSLTCPHPFLQQS